MEYLDFNGLIQRAAADAVSRVRKAKIGYVTSFNPNTYSVRVRLEPESTANEQTGSGAAIETNWLPLMRDWGGNGWGDYSPPKANPNPPYGDQVLVVWADHYQGVAIKGHYTDKERALSPNSTIAADAPSTTTGTIPGWGERWWVGPYGQKILVLNDGSVKVVGQDGSYVVVNPSNNKSILVHSSTGSSALFDGVGGVGVTGAGGAQVFVGNGAPNVGPGPTSGAATNIVTRADLQRAINDLVGAINGGCQAGSTANLTAPLAHASGTVTATD